MKAIELLEKLSEKYYGDAYSEIMGAIAEIKAKDEEIERLTLRAENLYADVCYMMNRNISFKTQAKKARSIVAMLFWEWKSSKRKKRWVAMRIKKYCFQKAYKILKDNA